MGFKRVIIIVLDSLGIGYAPDAEDYGDVGADTFGHIWKTTGGLHIPNLLRLGMGNLIHGEGVEQITNPQSYFARLREISLGKDTMTGHWEMMGLKVTSPFVTFTETGFPEELLLELEKASNRKIVGNKSASGTEILDELGEHQMKTGDLIVYTSADSVLQIAAHEEVIPPAELWDICKKAREITMKDEWKVGRIIARPYIGTGKGKFTRTSNRHDYAIKPFGKTVLNYIKESGLDVYSVGKINDIFDTEGITKSFPSKSNEDGMNHVIELCKGDFTGLLFANLVDFDAVYGHRRNPIGYGKCIEEFDVQLGQLLPELSSDDLLVITADHGTDPTYKGTDHTREYVPLILYSTKFAAGGKLKDGDTFANIGATIMENFEIEGDIIGSSYMDFLK